MAVNFSHFTRIHVRLYFNTSEVNSNVVTYSDSMRFRTRDILKNTLAAIL